MENFTKEKLPLPLTDGRYLYVRKEQLLSMKEDLDNFLHSNSYMVTKKFSVRALFSQGIHFNNVIEGYKDDLAIIEDVISKTHNNPNIPEEQRQRIINLYRGYQYILRNHDFNKDSIKKLYDILSKGLLSEEDLKEMGDYYRKNDVYIFYSNNLNVQPDKGINPELVEEYMDKLISFLSSDSYNGSMTDSYIKSQIVHFYFVYIHPYYDVNGRTSRTLSMWYLFEKEAYPYLIFNRGISLNKNLYYRIIRDVVKFANMSFFLNYMLKTVKTELEKEYLINSIVKSFGELSNIDRQTIYYILSNTGVNNVKDYTAFYNRYNSRKRPLEIYKEMILPLIEKDLLRVTRYTKSYIAPEYKNVEYELNMKYLDNDEDKIKQLKLR